MSFFKKVFGGGDDKEKAVQPQKRQIDLNQILEQVKEAKAMQVHFQGQTDAQVTSIDLNQLMAQATGNAEYLSGQSAEPRAQFVKKTTCHNCGAAKTLPPKTGYVYCDFCGSLTDYDFQKACEIPQQMPGPAYEAMVRETNADSQLARQTQDKDKFYEIQSRLFDRWVDLCPNAVSPRAKKDPEYRKQLVEYMAKTAVINEFDAEYQRYAGQVRQETTAIQWTGMYPKPLASGATFWPLYETVKAQLEHSFALLKEAGVLDLHPDGAPESLQRRMTWSMFCQGWLPVLAPEDSEKMIADAGLKGEYSVLEPVEITLRHCGGCGGELHTLPGAKVMVCEECGTRVDVGNPEVNCKNCAGMISFPVGQNRVQCPFCKSEAQRMSW